MANFCGLIRCGLTLIVMVIATKGPGQVSFTEFPGPTSPIFHYGALIDITSGPDGRLWFTENYADAQPTNIGRISTSGLTDFFPFPGGSSEGGICSGPDGNLWFTEYRSQRICRMSPDGQPTEFSGVSFPGPITSGSDGNLWFGELATRISRISPEGQFTFFPLPGNHRATGIAPGPEGNIWFTESPLGIIGRITTDGVITEFSLPTQTAYPYDIATGPDGNLWFTESGANKIGRISPGGLVSEFSIPTLACDPNYICAGPDGNMWFTERSGNKIARITMDGWITEYPVPTLSSEPLGITTGPDGNLWFVELHGNKIVKAVIDNYVGPAWYIVTSGFEVGGTLASLAYSDDNCLGLFPDDQTLMAQIRVGGTCNVQNPGALTFFFETSVGRKGLAQVVELRDFSVNSFVPVDGRIAPTIDLGIQVHIAVNAADYLGPNGELEARLTWVAINDEDPAQDGWLHCIDASAWSFEA